MVELNPREISGRLPVDEVYPLIESEPETARLVFPEDRFRFGEEMEFINADYNRLDLEQTRIFTQALKNAGFIFPARLAAGKGTILKPFDEGYFVKDAQNAVFHIKRVKGEPQVARTPLDPNLEIRTIKVSENQSRKFYGLVLTGDDRLFLLSYDDYRLIYLPLAGYDPETMDFKLIVNPLYRTAVYSDDKVIRAVLMDEKYQYLDRNDHVMPGAEPAPIQRFIRWATPFKIGLENPNSGYLTLDLKWHGWGSLAVSGLALVLFLILASRQKLGLRARLLDGALVLLTGVYGLVAVLFLPFEE